MKFEFSAGGVVFKKENDNVLVLVVQHGGYTHHWGFPKGHIGDRIKGENKEAAAVREVREETGIDAKILEPLEPIEYWYAYQGEKRKKTVYFFIMKLLGGSFSDKDREMQKVEWVPISQVSDIITFESEKKMFQQAESRIFELAKGIEISA